MGIVTVVFTVFAVMGGSFWANHTHVDKSLANKRPPEHCQFFDDRYSPEYKAMCDKWDEEHGND